MTKPPVTILIATAAVAVAVTVAGCGAASHHAAGDPAARASAMATSAQLRTARTVARKDFAGCQPAGTSVTEWETQLISRRKTRLALFACMGVTTPAGQARAKHCVVHAAKTAIGAAMSAGGQTPYIQTETMFITTAGLCFK